MGGTVDYVPCARCFGAEDPDVADWWPGVVFDVGSHKTHLINKTALPYSKSRSIARFLQESRCHLDNGCSRCTCDVLRYLTARSRQFAARHTADCTHFARVPPNLSTCVRHTCRMKRCHTFAVPYEFVAATCRYRYSDTALQS